jgi:3-oxoacid CoA-transferase B subunit
MIEGLTRELIALRVARELRPGMVVNLGIGLPTLVAGFAPPGVIFQAENSILGYGGILDDDAQFDPDVINAGGQPVALLPGASFFSSDASFAMIRGGHVDVAVLGGCRSPRKATWRTGWCPRAAAAPSAARWTWRWAPAA